jgi:membrane protein CcdC involved in cytochrome C biogenesis
VGPAASPPARVDLSSSRISGGYFAFLFFCIFFPSKVVWELKYKKQEKNSDQPKK